MIVTYVGSAFIISWEFMCCAMLLNIFAERKEQSNKYTEVLLIIAVVAAQFIILGLLQKVLVLKIIMGVLILVFGMYCLFEVTLLKSTIFVALFQSINLLCDFITLLVLGKFFGEKSVQIMADEIGAFLVSIISKIFMLFLIIILKRKLEEKSDDMLTDTEWLLLLVMPLVTIMSLTAIGFKYDLKTGETRDYVWIFVAIGLAMMNFMVFFLLEAILKRERKIRETEIVKERIEKETQLYYSISENYDLQRKMVHEFKNHISCIEELIKTERFHRLEDYLGDIDENLIGKVDSIDANHIIVNAILNTKYREAVEKGILMVLKVNDVSKIKLSDIDIVTILSNLLNNAIEACGKCEEKVIKVKFVMDDCQTVISVNNPMQVPPKMKQGNYMTSKNRNKDFHGYGINNIIDVVEKYHGKYFIECEDGFFKFTIII